MLSQKMEELLSEIKSRFPYSLVCRHHCHNEDWMLSTLFLVIDFFIKQLELNRAEIDRIMFIWGEVSL